MAGAAVMDAWQILGIPAGSDVGTIKRAYAAKIKLHRPDEAPAEFQRIHQAYKSLLALARREQCEQEVTDFHVSPDGADEDPCPIATNLANAELPLSGLTRSAANEPVMPAELDMQRVFELQADPQQQQRAFAELKQQIDTNFASRMGLIRVESWQFLARSPWLLDGECNARLSLYLFQQLCEQHQQWAATKRRSPHTSRSQRPMEVSFGILALFDQLFNWQGQRQWLQLFADERTFKLIFDRLDNAPVADPVLRIRGHIEVFVDAPKQKKVQPPFDWERWLGTMIMLMVAFFMLKPMLDKVFMRIAAAFGWAS